MAHICLHVDVLNVMVDQTILHMYKQNLYLHNSNTNAIACYYDIHFLFNIKNLNASLKAILVHKVTYTCITVYKTGLQNTPNMIELLKEQSCSFAPYHSNHTILVNIAQHVHRRKHTHSCSNMHVHERTDRQIERQADHYFALLQVGFTFAKPQTTARENTFMHLRKGLFSLEMKRDTCILRLGVHFHTINCCIYRQICVSFVTKFAFPFYNPAKS